MASLPLAFRLVLGAELALWARQSRAPALWWRDDDARLPTPPLERLLGLSRRHDAPVTLAVVAGPGLPDLVQRLRIEPQAEIAVHGFKHVNRQPEGEGHGEIVDSDSVDWVRAQLRSTLAAFHRTGAAPTLFVPPWNNLKPQLLDALAGSPLTAVSGFARDRDQAGPVTRLDAHLDVLRWNGGGRFRGTWKFLARMRRLLRQRRLAGRWDEPIGLLTHHLDHDEATWRFLEQFLTAFRIAARHRLTGAPVGRSDALSA